MDQLATLKVLTAIARCRTAAFGGHLDECIALRLPSGHLLQLLPQPALPEVSGQRARPLARSAAQELLPTRYVHVVFTLPHELAPLALQNKKSCTICCCRPAPQRCSKSLAIPSISARRSASSACCTPGIRNSNSTLTHDACHYHLLRFQRTKEAGPPRGPPAESACLSEGAAR